MIGAARAGDPYPSTPVWIDVGSGDPFRANDSMFVRDLRAHGHPIAFHVWPGGHDQDYWQQHWSSYLGFYADALAHCRRS